MDCQFPLTVSYRISSDVAGVNRLTWVAHKEEGHFVSIYPLDAGWTEYMMKTTAPRGLVEKHVTVLGVI